MKKVLIVASVVSFIEWFNRDNLLFLKNQLGCEVHVACNFDYMDDTDVQRTEKYIEYLKEQGFFLHNISFARSPFSLKNINSYKKLKQMISTGSFDLIHCHTPTVSMMTRLAAKKERKKGCIVMYTCHGFHFHNSSPRKNWMIYYPVERFLAKYCDYLVTINKEDYRRACTFKCRNVRYIPGVGVDLERIRNISVDKHEKRKSLGIPDDATLIVSAGELIDRKNHEIIIRALESIKDLPIYYIIAGKGELYNYLSDLIREFELSERVFLLGFRNDVFELYHISDISAFPSKIEGLGLSGIEAMAAGIPLVSSNVHGILDYVIDGETGYAIKPNDAKGFAEAIRKLAEDPSLRESMRKKCIKAVSPFDMPNALEAMWDIYREILVD